MSEAPGEPDTQLLLDDQSSRWQRGERVPAEDYLARYPRLHAEALLDLITNEVLLRQQAGETPCLEEYQQRFPHLAEVLRVQFAVERAIHDGDPLLCSRSPVSTLVLPEHPSGETPSPTVPGYEILGELGRGGMGVVYKARQRGANRLVALKMIRAIEYASLTDRLRFQIETEAVARLQHPNIVQLYEVGEERGQPFFSLELCDGGTLTEQLKKQRPTPRESAQLIETLARAMHYAHLRGVVHRDLKPGNVLLAGAEGVPKITDFGLAKRIDAEARDVSQSGEIMGTAAYMAPEQAAGKVRDTGPAADVYALGGLLYECLTGRAPFDGPQHVVLVKVLSDEPEPPSRQAPVPADLETICLKCLSKEPARRYASAEDLADDLARFLVSEPIVARPAGPLERALKWARRQPAAASLLGVSVLAALGLAVLSVVAVRQWQSAVAALRSKQQAQVKTLLAAHPRAVRAILADLADQREVIPQLHQVWNEEDSPANRPRRMRAALALLPFEPELVLDALVRWMLEAPDPAELILVRECLRLHGDELRAGLWRQLQQPDLEPVRRLRLLAALAAFDRDGFGRKKVDEQALELWLSDNPLYLGSWTEALRPVRHHLLGPLTQAFRTGAAERRLAAAYLLGDYASDRPEVLAELLQDADRKQFALLFSKVLPHRERVVAVLSDTVKTPLEAKKTDDDKETLAKQQANAAVALLRLGQPGQVWPVLAHRPDPRARSYLIHYLAPLGADRSAVVRRLEVEKEVSIRRALLLALGEFKVSASEQEGLIPLVLRLYKEEADAGMHAAAEWLLRWWKQEGRLKALEQEWVKDEQKRQRRLDRIRQELKANPVRQVPAGRWYVNGQGQTMVVVPGPVTFGMGSPADEVGREGGAAGEFETLRPKRIDRTFAISAHEVTVGQFLKFRKDHYSNKTHSPSHGHPVNTVTWSDAAAYCNWLSDQEGIPESQWCYAPKVEKDVRDWKEGYGEGTKLKASYLHLEGYRLPSEAEWEFSCRAGTVTSRYHGETEELLGRYAWYTTNSQGRWMLPVGSLKPNDLGLFDMLGNAVEWCQQPAADDQRAVEGIGIVSLRGGAFFYRARDIRSAYRLGNGPTNSFNHVGFRPARTFR
jgi:formylglycine-generating enzyme required for sulfatase activity/tRNA A-37 threonylcarbamoyl transferase component Bud32